jgi:hypothetical protein
MTALALPIRPEGRGRLVDIACLAVTGVILAMLVVDLVPLLPNLDSDKIAIDFNLYVDTTRRFMNGGGYYLPYQLEGPYAADPGVILYPPTFIPMMLPFTVLPWPTYWLAPIAAVVYATWVHRPRIVAWPLIALCLWWPGTIVNLVAGNPVLLFMGALALATIWHWQSVVIFLKPSLIPFAFFGVWKRSWWIALGVLVLLSLPFGVMWLEYAKVLVNARHELGLLYNLGQVPLMLLPVAIWAGRTRGRSADRSETVAA